MKKKKSLIIIGSGITGLTSGLAWSKVNNPKEDSVTIIEKENRSGGYVTSYERKGYFFDTSQMIPNINNLLELLGVKIKLKKFTGYYMRLFIVNPKTKEKKIINIPSGIDKFTEMLINNYPDEKNKIKYFMKYSQSMFDEIKYLKTEPKINDIIKMLFRCTKIIKNSSKTFKEYYEQFEISNKELREIFNINAAFSGLPEDSVAALTPLGAMFSLLEGAYRPKGPFREFPMALEKRFRSLGGKIIFNDPVEKILTLKGQAIGVRLASRRIIHSDYIITTIDPKIALNKLVGKELIKKLDKKYAAKLDSVKMSVSSLNISLGLDNKIDLAKLGLDCGYNVITTGGETFSKLFKAYDKGKIGFTKNLFHTAVICPSLTTGGKPSITIRGVPMGLGNWKKLREKNIKKYKAEKEKWANFFIDIVQEYMIPNLRKHIKVIDISTPATYARYSGSPTGSIYDMAPYIDNFGLKRLKFRTPIKNLFQPKFSHGIFGSMLGGLQVIDMITNGKIMKGYSRLTN